MTFTRLVVAAATLAVVPAGAASGQQSAVPVTRGPLRITVAYPAAGAAIDVEDSTFLFGSVGNGRATLTIAGQRVTVAPNGAWLAWIALPRDSSMVLRLVARLGGDSAVVNLPLVRAGWVRQRGAWLDRGSMSPVNKNIWMPSDEALPLTVRAAAGASVRLILPGGEVVQFTSDSLADPPREGLRAFDRDDRNLLRSARGDRYVATFRGEINPVKFSWDTATVRRAARMPILEVALRGDTTRAPWDLEVSRHGGAPVAVTLDDDVERRGGTDRITIGRAFPTGTYTWFLPQGTRTRADMRLGDQVRLRMSRDAVAWVPLTDVHPARATDDTRTAIMGSPTLSPGSGITTMRIPLTRPVPMSVDERERGVTITLYDAVSDANWIRYGAEQRFVQLVTWKQESADRVSLSVNFDRPMWGWRARVDGSDLVFEFREPPRIDIARPLAGRHIVIDAGHPPGGACGPTGLCEPEINLDIARIVRDMLVAGGARVTMTRNGPEDVGLWPRVALADSLDADLLVSIHNNAFPDGVNPFTNNGTTTFFNHPQSLALARAVQSRLVARIGLRNLGVARGDLALTRPTWYPAILTEGFYLMFPEQEATLRTPAGQRRYALGVVEGITSFLRDAVPRTAQP